MERAEFDKMIDTLVTPRRPTMTNVGPSIIELIEEEFVRNVGSDYATGVNRALSTIETANREGRKPFYALKLEFGKACAEGNHEIVRGLKTAIFIFNTPYKWIAGERP